MRWRWRQRDCIPLISLYEAQRLIQANISQCLFARRINFQKFIVLVVRKAHIDDLIWLARE